MSLHWDIARCRGVNFPELWQESRTCPVRDDCARYIALQNPIGERMVSVMHAPSISRNGCNLKIETLRGTQ